MEEKTLSLEVPKYIIKHVIKKNKKKKKKLLYPSESKKKLFSLDNILNLTNLLIFIFLIIHIIGPFDTIPYTIVQDKQYNLVKKGSNTTSIHYNGNLAKEYKNILLNYYHNHPVICLHHIDYEEIKYRVCLLQRTYLLINPTITAVTTNQKYLKDIMEHSISCKNETNKKRFQCITLHWTDEFNNQLQSYTCGDAAIALQMMMDEFEGNKHCF
jgi:peptide deformylase